MNHAEEKARIHQIAWEKESEYYQPSMRKTGWYVLIALVIFFSLVTFGFYVYLKLL